MVTIIRRQERGTGQGQWGQGWSADGSCLRTLRTVSTWSRPMSKIIRTEPGPILSKAVEYHGFVYLPGITAKDTSKDIKGQTAEVLEQHGTDKTRLLQATIWVKHIKDRALMNEVWTPWLPKDGAPARACVQAEMAAPDVLVEIMITACK